MQNIEFKAELRDMQAARAQCAALKCERLGLLRQTDTYFRMPDGRLKCRQAPSEPTEWIFYHRPDRVSPRMSHFTILTDEQARRRWGTHSLREWLNVVKTRELWMHGTVRIHIDDVEHLGHFIEFEAPVLHSTDVQHCHEVVGSLRQTFGPTMGEPVSASYCDLMQQFIEERDGAPRPRR